MSPAQTSDRLPQPMARLKVLCTAEGGHYCWPFCTGGNIEGGVKRLRGSTKHSHTLLCWLFPPLLKYSRSHLNRSHLPGFFVTCSRSTVYHLVAEAWNNMDRELRGEILQIEEKMTSSIPAVNASESSWAGTETALQILYRTQCVDPMDYQLITVIVNWEVQASVDLDAGTQEFPA